MLRGRPVEEVRNLEGDHSQTGKLDYPAACVHAYSVLRSPQQVDTRRLDAAGPDLHNDRASFLSEKFRVLSNLPQHH